MMFKKSVALFCLFLVGCGSSAQHEARLKFTEEAKKSGLPIIIEKIEHEPPHSAGGVHVDIEVTNISDKPIKYLNYSLKPYNAVGDLVRGEIKRTSLERIREVGPIAPGERSSRNWHWENVWYNSTIKCIRVTRISITYMDKSSRTFSSSSAIDKMLRPGVKNSCDLN